MSKKKILFTVKKISTISHLSRGGDIICHPLTSPNGYLVPLITLFNRCNSYIDIDFPLKSPVKLLT